MYHQSAGMATNSIILLLVLSISCLCSTRDVYIQPSEGEHCPGTPCYNITTFGEMADSFSNSFGLVVHFLEGTHLLDLQELVVFKKLTNAVFEGDGTMEQGFHETVWQSTVVIKCTNGTGGIGFVNSSNITFKYITITNCGAQANAMPGDIRLCKGVSLSFFNVENVIFIDHVSVQNGSGSGLFILTNGADITINQSSFAQNGYGSSKNDNCENFAIFYTDELHTFSPQKQVYKTFITSTNSSFGGTNNDFLFAGLLIITFQRSYSIDIVLESIVAYKNNAIGSIYIASASFMPTYDLTINNLQKQISIGSDDITSSEPIDICFCDDSSTMRSCSQPQPPMTAYPGEEINISVGQLNGTAPGILQIKPLDTTDSSAYTEIHNTGAMNCTTITLKPIQQTYTLKLFRYIEHSKSLKISLIDCPLGFNVSNKSKMCDCEELKNIIDTITCNRNTGKITRKGDVWIGNISGQIFVHKTCPFDYCNASQVSFSLTDLDDPQCALNRTGILCGECRDNLSLALGSNNCIHCPQFSYLALIIPFAAAGFGLVALLMVLNLTVSIGTINGLIFYASIVKISESTGIFFPNGPIPVLSQFIAWLNLDLGIETCFYSGMTAYAKVWLQFVFPLYIWFIIATIIVLCHYSTWLSNKIGSNVVQVLATLILLSFTKIFRTFAPALTWVCLPSTNNCTIVKWYVDGTISFHSLEHYLLMAAAVLFLLLAVPYVFVLLFDAVIEKYLTKLKCFRKQWIKFKPFIDAYHGPYKDNCRFWTGLLLLVRMSFTLVSLRLDTFGTLIFITASTTVLLSLLVTFEGVYQKKYLNILECSFFLNLGLLSALAAGYQDHNNTGEIVTIISLGVALVTFVGILFFHVSLRTKNSKWFRKYVKKFCRKRNEDTKLLTDVSSNEPPSKPTSSDVFLKRETLIECSTE